ncbi:hypothetical protein A2738_01615 [Candidatus Nomurabacteria bacterium RIFCSPHIGHO2_01_FULL_42_15]|uniref:Uncharacterized protein n=1 Tax=Candidatus Nomurabacteria bacterium RIFCSPHIGHO2_01_FULL_42_15 TaxID=1801742 RepID=A0A1F6VG47_9BACT|nr:MAG: hypothetical protein A2738_01615 [Candidatus Nomurabacteria bacterium RIFCSPHIGHO2_01_FULL_42_15]OGI93016.1 MAG: hypothetical protein A3A99_00555 [Candidatus Nomurabacteria bacterium RIFCSPLOWO2_01_FULL_41_18]
MGKAYIFLISGIWLAVLPHLGFPYSWQDILTSLSGIALIVASFMLYRDFKTQGIKKETTFDNFSENNFKGGEATDETTN